MFLFTANMGVIGGTDDEIDELDIAERELSEAELRPPNTSDAYWARIRDKLLSESVSPDLFKAIKEWSRKGMPYGHPNSACELCGKTPIYWNFPIQNKARKKALHIGSECIVNFLHVSKGTSLESIKVQILREIKNRRSEAEKRKKERKDKSPAQLESDELLDMEKAIRDYIRLAGTGEDFFFVRHLHALNEILLPLTHLGVTTPPKTKGDEALHACLKIQRLASGLGLVPSEDLGILEIARDIIHHRNLRDRVKLMKALREGLSSVFKGADPNNIVIRLYEEYDDYRATRVHEAEASLASFLDKLRQRYKSSLSLVEKYEHLKFVLDAGLIAVQDEAKNRFSVYEKGLQDKKLLEIVFKAKEPEVQRIFDSSSLFPEPDLRKFNSAMAKSAANVVDFLQSLRRGDDKKAVDAVEATFGRKIQDISGVQAALLQSAEDSTVVPEDRGVGTIDDFVDLIELKSPAVIRLIIKEVDDLTNVRFGEALLFDRMSKSLGFDVEDTFKYFDAYNPVDAKLCRKLVKEWEAGKKPGADELKVFMVRRSAKPEKPKRSMLDQIRMEIGSDVGWVIKQARLMAAASRRSV